MENGPKPAAPVFADRTTYGTGFRLSRNVSCVTRQCRVARRRAGSGTTIVAASLLTVEQTFETRTQNFVVAARPSFTFNSGEFSPTGCVVTPGSPSNHS